MKKVLCVAILFFAMASVASAAWVYPPTVVQSYYPIGPVYAYPAPAPVYMAPAPVIVDGMIVPAAPAVRVYRYPSYMVAPPYYVPVQPVRNRIRANRLW